MWKKRIKKGSIIDEEKEFLDYLARSDENARKEENLKKRFGKEKYKRIYNLIGGIKTGALPKKEGDKRNNILYIRDEGLKFLEEYQKEKNQKRIATLTLISGVILVLVTRFYAYQTYQLNKITAHQFESENRPYIYIEEVKSNIKERIYKMKIVNFGKFPGRLVNIFADSPDCQNEFSIDKFPKTTVLKSNEEIFVQVNERKNNLTENATLDVTIEYRGVGELNRVKYYYVSKLKRDKKNNSISVGEGLI